MKAKRTPKYDKHCLEINDQDLKIKNGEPFVVRLNVPVNKTITFTDMIRGEISINSNDLDDQVILKSDGFPTYHLGVVVDDHLMEITHVIRAEEWISSTPKHVLLYQALGWKLPLFAHLPIIRNPDKSKLSKRKNPVWAMWYIEQGFLPEAVLNYLALLGWSHPEEKELFSLKEFITLFDLADVKPVGPVFDLVKLTWVNQQYLQKKTPAQLKELILNFFPDAHTLSNDTLDALIPLVNSRMQTLTDFEKQTKLFFAQDLPQGGNKDLAKELLKELTSIPNWNHAMIFAAMKKLLLEHKIKMSAFYELFTGEKHGLPLPEVLEILGKEKTCTLLKKL